MYHRSNKIFGVLWIQEDVEKASMEVESYEQIWVMCSQTQLY